MLTVATAHIYLDDRGVAWIDDTNVKVIEVVLDRLIVLIHMVRETFGESL